MGKLLAVLILVLFSMNSVALERKNLADISLKELLADTQAQPEGTKDRHITFVWWVPFEYWASVFARDPDLPDAVRAEMLKVLKKHTVLAVVQADVSPIGTFHYYSEEDVVNNLGVSYTSGSKKEIFLTPEENEAGDMQLLMSQVSPIMQAAMGNLGANLHFFIYSDLNENGKRVIDPYKEGLLKVELSNNDGEKLHVEYPTPLNSLFVPRKCPNGKGAHISWNYCPWSGEKIN